MNLAILFRGFAFFAAIALAGCSSSNSSSDPDAPPNGLVRGRITLDGSPLSKVAVVISQPETSFGTNVITNESGEYEIGSYKGKGLFPGTYYVAIRSSENYFASSEEQSKAIFANSIVSEQPSVPKPAETPRTSIPLKYQQPQTSGFSIEVASGNNPSFDFNLQGERPK
jgi:hypothetical protein